MDDTVEIVDKYVEICGVIDGHDGSGEVVPVVRCSWNKRVKSDVCMTCWRASLTHW